MSGDRHQIDHEIIDWGFGDETMTLSAFLTKIEEARSVLSDGEFAKAIVLFQYRHNDDYDNGGSFTITAQRIETDAEFAVREDRERQALAQQQANAERRAKLAEQQERALLAALFAKYGAPLPVEPTCPSEAQS